MIRSCLLLVILLLAGCDANQSADQTIAETPESPPPTSAFDFLDTNGNGYNYDDLKGQWLVVNYWATWCAPCVKEIPELIHLGESHEDILVLGVNFDAPPPEEMARQVARMKITFPVYAEDPSAVLGIEMPQVLPTTVIIDPEGVVQDVLVGPQTESSLLAAIRS